VSSWFWRLPHHSSALVRNDSGSRYLPTIILQITLLVSVKQGDLCVQNHAAAKIDFWHHSWYNSINEI